MDTLGIVYCSQFVNFNSFDRLRVRKLLSIRYMLIIRSPLTKYLGQEVIFREEAAGRINGGAVRRWRVYRRHGGICRA